MTSNYGKLILFEEKNINKDLKLIRKGDVIFFHRQSFEDNIPKVDNKYPGHCGLYLGDNYFIHCTISKKRVVISNFEKNMYWNRVMVGSKDILSDALILKRIKK